jgi:hypothetical protein
MFTTIKLEDYFDFQSLDDIRIKGHRIGIQDVLNYKNMKIFLNLVVLILQRNTIFSFLDYNHLAQIKKCFKLLLFRNPC